MVRIKRPARSLASQRVDKDTDPSISLTAVNSDVEQHGQERCSEPCSSTLDGYPTVEENNNKDAETGQFSEPCDVETDITTRSPSSTTFSNISTDVKLKYYRRSEHKRKGSPFSVEHLQYCYRRRKGFFWSVKPLKTYRRRRIGYMSLGISPLPFERKQENAEEASLPEEAPSGSVKKKILVLDINGLLADIVPVAHLSNEYKPDPNTIITGKAVFKRPFCDEFLEFCFERFNVGVWSSRIMKNVDFVLNLLMGKEREKLLFCWDQSQCTCSRYYTPENKDKPLFFKELKKLWENSKTDLPWKKGDYDESNTLLLDDSPYKALLNPPNTAIFPQTYQYSNERDSALGPDGDLRTYLEGICMAPNVQEYVKQNPYGQDPITENHPSWSFYQEVIESTLVGSLIKPYQSRGKDVSKVNNTSVVAEITKECHGSNGSIDHQDEKSIPGFLETGESNRRLMELAKVGGNFPGSLCFTQRGCKRGRSQSPRHAIGSHSRSLSPKKCRRSNSPAPSHGSAFGGDKARNCQTLHPECWLFPQGRCLKGASCRFVHHKSHHQSYADRRVHEHEDQTFVLKSVRGECYGFSQGKCKWGASCRFLHSVPNKADINMEGNETHGKQWDSIRRDKAVHRVCSGFIQGKCNWGANCRFLHSVPVKTDIAMEGNETLGKQCDNIRRDKSEPRGCYAFIQGKCYWGATCRFLHSLPDKTDLGTEGKETHGKKCDNIRRENAAPRECNDFIRSKCNWGGSSRFLHSVPDKTSRLSSFHKRYYPDVPSSSKKPGECGEAQSSSFNEHGRCKALPEICRNYSQGATVGLGSTSQFGDTSRYKTVREICRNYTQGRCHNGSDCRYLHQEPGLTFGSGSSSQAGILGRYKAMPEVCRSYTQGRCFKGSDCPYLHQEQDLTGSGSTSQLTETSRYKSLPELCKYYCQGRCHNGSNCQFLHREPGVSVGSGSTSQLGETSRFKVVPELCRNNIQGRFNNGSDCRYLHQERGLTFGLGCTAQFGETSRFQALPQVCRNYIQGRCHKGWNCQYLHQDTGSVFTRQFGEVSRFKALPEVCRNYTQGRCHKGSDCWYLHQEPGSCRILWQYKDLPYQNTSSSTLWNTKSRPRQCVEYTQGKCLRVHCRYLHHESDQYGSSGFSSSHQRDADVSLNSNSVDSFGDAENIRHETSAHENTESRVKELIPKFPVIDEKGDTMETLPNQPMDSESFREAPIIPADEAEDIKDVENVVSMNNLGDSDQMILDAGNICHETSVHENNESGAKELIPHFPLIEEKGVTVEALPNHPIDSDSFRKDFVVPDDDTKDEKVPENVVCTSMDNLGDLDRMIQDADKPPDRIE